MNEVYELLIFILIVMSVCMGFLSICMFLEGEIKFSITFILVLTVLVLTCCELKTFIGLDHNVDQENLIMISPDNIKASWSQLVHDDIINTALLINEKGINHNLNANVDHVMGLDIVKKNHQDSIIRLDYVERVSMPDNQCRYDVHKDMVLMSNEGVKKLRHDIYENKISNLPDKIKGIPDINTTNSDENTERLRDVLNSSRE